MGYWKSSVHRRRKDPNAYCQNATDIIPKMHDKMEYEDVEKEERDVRGYPRPSGRTQKGGKEDGAW